MLSRNYEVISLRNQHFNIIWSIPQIINSSIKSFLFDYLISSKWVRLHLVLSLSITSGLFIESIANACTFNFLFNNEIRLAVNSTFFINQRVFTDVLQHTFSVDFISLPSGNVIIGRFILQSLKNQLIFLCYLC